MCSRPAAAAVPHTKPSSAVLRGGSPAGVSPLAAGKLLSLGCCAAAHKHSTPTDPAQRCCLAERGGVGAGRQGEPVGGARAGMGLSCCVLTGGLGEEDWRQWAQHPARKDWDVIMDLGEGAFSQARSCEAFPNPTLPYPTLRPSYCSMSHSRFTSPCMWLCCRPEGR